MLKDSVASVAEVAERLGYFNQGDFSRAWKRWTGITPQQFRRDRSEKRRIKPRRKSRTRTE